jgi:hypothetical protein
MIFRGGLQRFKSLQESALTPLGAFSRIGTDHALVMDAAVTQRRTGREAPSGGYTKTIDIK